MTASLFDKYGGFSSISKIVSSFYDKVIDSDVVGPYFDDVDLRRLIDHQTKFIASVMGGPASYSREALARVHHPLEIDETAFEEVQRLLRQTLDEHGIEAEDVDKVLREIAEHAPVIVSRPGA